MTRAWPALSGAVLLLCALAAPAALAQPVEPPAVVDVAPTEPPVERQTPEATAAKVDAFVEAVEDERAVADAEPEASPEGAPETAVELEAPPGPGPADPAELEAFLDAVFATEMADGHYPGAVFCLVKDGELFFAKGYGVANVETREPMDPARTVMRVASISKLFTATAIMQLAEKGRVDLAEDANAYLKRFAIPATFPEPVTVANLITHTGGFDDKFVGSARRKARNVPPLGEYLAAEMPPRVQPPNTVYSYSNHAFALAGFLAQEVTGTDFAAYVEANVLRPLGMASSGFHLTDDMRARLATGYQYRNGAYEAVPYENEIIYPAGAMHTTATDLAKFMLAHLQNGTYGGARILGTGTAQVMHRQYFTNDPSLPGTCLGFYEHWENGLHGIMHDGLLRGYASELVLFPEQQVGWFVSTNSGSILYDTGTLARAVTSALLDRYYPSAPRPLPEPPAGALGRLRDMEGSYIPNRRSRTTIQKMAMLLGQTRLEATPAGRLVEHRPTGEPRRWVERTPLHFVNVEDGEQPAVWRRGAAGAQFIVGTSAYDRIAWYETTKWQLRLIGFVVVMFATAVLWWLPGALWRRMRGGRGEMPPTHPGHPAKFVAGVTGVLVLVCLGVVVWTLSGDTYDLTFGLPLTLKAALLIPFACVPLVGLIVIACLGAWLVGHWRFLGRVYYTLVAAAGLAFVWFTHYWNLLGFHY